MAMLNNQRVILWFSIQLGMSSSQLTNSIIFQRGRRKTTNQIYYLAWYSHDIPMVFPWYPHDIPIKSHETPYIKYPSETFRFLFRNLRRCLHASRAFEVPHESTAGALRTESDPGGISAFPQIGSQLELEIEVLNDMIVIIWN